MQVAGISLTRDLVLELAEFLVFAGERGTAAAILKADAADEDAYLTLEELNLVVVALESGPDDLQPLRLAILADLGHVDPSQ